ncbi:MAG: BatD family protein [Gammaproteobacteria bacterium]|nr:BatD family protein [Gammaproteobacteria bacterium]
MRFLISLVFALATGTAALAQEQPIVRATISPETVNVGESAELTVTVLVPTWFTRPSTYPSFELANAITRLPADSSYNIRERIGNESWSGIVRTYEIYPLLGATYRLSGQSIEVTYANPGGDPRTAAVKIPEVAIRGRVPAGAESLDPYIAGRGLSLRLDVEGDLDSLEAGDAVVLEYVAELDGLPVIFIPPLAPNLEFEGASVYADVPDVEDGKPARRSEKLTLVFDAGGEFRVPDFDLSYWNTDAGAIETIAVPGFAILVDGPVATIAANEQATESRWRMQTAVFAAIAALVYFLLKVWPIAASHYREAAVRRRQSEPFAFKALQSALRSGDTRSAYHALLLWLERLEPGLDARQFARQYGDESLAAGVCALSASLYASDAQPCDSRQLGASIQIARARYNSEPQTGAGHALPPLNP